MPTLARLGLLALVFAVSLAVRAGSALANLDVHTRLGHATLVARERAQLVRYASRFVGVRYVFGGTSPATGFDCSGFTRYVYAHFGIALPHYSGGQFGLGRGVSRTRLRPGDLVFFDRLGHVGIYLGAGRFIHAPHTGTRVAIDPIAGWYRARYDGARSVL